MLVVGWDLVVWDSGCPPPGDAMGFMFSGGGQIESYSKSVAPSSGSSKSKWVTPST